MDWTELSTTLFVLKVREKKVFLHSWEPDFLFRSLAFWNGSPTN